MKPRSVHLILPVLLLLGVAIINRYLVYRYDLAIDQFGGFGMFSSLDGYSTRYIGAYAFAGETKTVLNLESYQSRIGKLISLPKADWLQGLLNDLSCDKNLVPEYTDRLELVFYKTQFRDDVVRPVPVWKGQSLVCPE